MRIKTTLGRFAGGSRRGRLGRLGGRGRASPAPVALAGRAEPSAASTPRRPSAANATTRERGQHDGDQPGPRHPAEATGGAGGHPESVRPLSRAARRPRPRSPSSGSPRRRRGRSSAPRHRPAPAAPPAAPAAARPCGRAPPRRPAPGTSRSARRRIAAATSGDGRPAPLPLDVGAADHDVARARDDVRRPLGAALSSHQRSSPTCSTSTTCPCTGCTDGSAARNLAPDAGAVDHRVRPAVAGARQPVQVEPGDRAAGRQHPRGQPVEVDRHLDDRRGERPAAVVARGHVDGLAQVGHGVGPPRLLVAGRATTSVPSRSTTPLSGCSAASAANASYVVRDQASTRSCGQAR